MFGANATKKLIIVSDDKTLEFANYMRQLVSANDDTEEGVIGTPDGAVDAVVWSANKYMENSPTISSNEHILFIGENKISKPEIANMPVKFEKFGMKYGWLGHRAMMIADDTAINENNYPDFLALCGSYAQTFNEMAYSGSKPKFGKLRGLKIAASILDPAAGAALVIKDISLQKRLVRNQQYKALTAIMYFDGLQAFLEE